MVFVLRNLESGEAVVLGEQGNVTIGRSRINKLLLKDLGSSKKHAEIKIKNGVCSIADLGSKRGTFINNEKILEETQLADEDVICFGLHNLRYRFFYPKFQTLTDDSVADNTAIALRETLKELNVTLAEVYTKECTHYTTELISLDRLKLTKILDALVDRKHIVTPIFWFEIVKHLQEVAEIPNIYRHSPKIEDCLIEKGVPDLIPKKNRRELFNDKLFIFLDGILEAHLENLILKCGGDTVGYKSEANFVVTLKEEKRFKEVVLISKHLTEDTCLTMTYFLDKLRQYNKAVRKMSIDDVYIAILKGFLDNDNFIVDREDNITDVTLHETETVIIVDEDSDDREAEPSYNTRKKKKGKSNLTTLHRWITPVKKTNTDENRVEKETGNDLDISLSMSSSDDSDNEVREPVASTSKEKFDNSKFYTLNMSSDSDSEIEQRPKLLGRNKNVRVTAMEDTSTEETVANIEKHLNSLMDDNNNGSVSKSIEPQQTSELNKMIVERNIRDHDSSRNSFIIWRDRRLRPQNSICPNSTNVSETCDETILKSNNESHAADATSSPTRSHIDSKEKVLKVNQINKLGSSSTPKENSNDGISDLLTEQMSVIRKTVNKSRGRINPPENIQETTVDSTCTGDIPNVLNQGLNFQKEKEHLSGSENVRKTHRKGLKLNPLSRLEQSKSSSDTSNKIVQKRIVAKKLVKERRRKISQLQEDPGVVSDNTTSENTVANIDHPLNTLREDEVVSDNKERLSDPDTESAVAIRRKKQPSVSNEGVGETGSKKSRTERCTVEANSKKNTQAQKKIVKVNPFHGTNSKNLPDSDKSNSGHLNLLKKFRDVQFELL